MVKIYIAIQILLTIIMILCSTMIYRQTQQVIHQDNIEAMTELTKTITTSLTAIINNYQQALPVIGKVREAINQVADVTNALGHLPLMKSHVQKPKQALYGTCDVVANYEKNTHPAILNSLVQVRDDLNAFTQKAQQQKQHFSQIPQQLFCIWLCFLIFLFFNTLFIIFFLNKIRSNMQNQSKL